MCKMIECMCVYPLSSPFSLLSRVHDPEGIDVRLPFLGFASPIGTHNVQNGVLVCVCSVHFPFSQEFGP